MDRPAPPHRQPRNWLLAGVLALCSGPGAAATLEVSPVLHELPATQQAIRMSISNHGSAPATLQVRAFAWAQRDGRESLTPAPEVILSPPMFRLEAGRSQIVRAMFPGMTPASEMSYRILIDELPEAGASEPLRFALRLSVPVFRLPPSPTAQALNWQLEADGRRLVATNSGGRRERIRELTLVAAGGESTQPASPWGMYLLAGHSRSWTVAPEAALKAGDRWTLTARTDAGRIEVPLVVAP
jgi:fimbrial chaperone protein